MHVVLSLTLGGGLLLVFLALTAPERAAPPPDVPAAAPPRSHGRAIATALAGAVAGLLTQVAFGWPALAVAAALVGALLPAWYRQQREQRRREGLDEAVAEAVEALRDATRVGSGLEAGLRALARSGPAPLRPAFRALERDARLEGFEAAIAQARERVAHPAFDMLVAACLMSYRVGGRNLATVLDGLGRSLRASARARREVRAQQAEQVLSARVIAALPLGLLVAIRATNPAYLDVFSTPTGQLVLAACLLSVAAGYAAMLRVTRLPDVRRVLR